MLLKPVIITLTGSNGRSGSCHSSTRIATDTVIGSPGLCRRPGSSRSTVQVTTSCGYLSRVGRLHPC